MEKLLAFLLRKTILYTLSFVLITAIIYGFIVASTTPLERARLYLPANTKNMGPKQIEIKLNQSIKDYHLEAPYVVQYLNWLNNFLKGNWGYSPTLRVDVLQAITNRLPPTIELTLYSILLFLPIGLLSGLIAAGHKNKFQDLIFRFSASVATSIPTLILAILLIIFFSINLRWFGPDRLTSTNLVLVNSENFRLFTGLITIDGLLNSRPDVSWDALKHLVLPATTLALPQWAILTRLTRTGILDELKKEYITMARGMGLPEWKLQWQYALKNVTPILLSNSMLSVAMLLTNTYIVEEIFHYPGLSYLGLKTISDGLDSAIIMGFAVISILLVLLSMFILDILLYVFDRRAGVSEIR